MKMNLCGVLLKTKWIVAGAILLAGNSAMAQSVEDVQKNFPDDYAVIQSVTREMRIFFKNNEPVAETKEDLEILALNDRANGMYNRYRLFHGTFNEIKNIEAYTKVPEGTKYRKIKVVDFKTQSSVSSGVFYDDSKETIFDFPSLVKGAVASVSHAEYNKDAHFLTPFYFTTYMPIVSARFTVSFPSNMQVKYILKNNGDGVINVREEKKGRETVLEFTSSNTKAKDRYGDAPPRAHFEPHVIVYIEGYKNDKGEQVNYLKNVDELYKWNYGFLKGINTEPSPALKHLADSLTNGLTSEKEKVKKIYSWVQEHIKYVAFEAGLEGFIPRQAADVCSKRYGDCKDMSSLLTELMKIAGLKSYFTWIGTRDIPYDYTDVPLPITDNHMISTVNIGDEWIFLDGTDPNCIFGTPSKGIQGKQALVAINEKEYKLIRVPVMSVDKNYVIDSTFISINDGGIKGTSSVYYNGYFGADLFNILLYRDGKETKDYVKARMGKGSNKFILDDYSVNKINPAEKIMNIQTKFEVPDYGKKIADELYINLNLDRFYNTAIIDTAKRKVPVDNDFRFHVKNYTILEMPKGYEVSFLPENHQYSNSLFGFKINYKHVDGKVIATQDFSSDVMILDPKDFDKWNDAIRELSGEYKKQIVLKKK